MQKYNVAADPSDNVIEFLEEHELSGIPKCLIFSSAGDLVYSGCPGDKNVDKIMSQLN